MKKQNKQLDEKVQTESLDLSSKEQANILSAEEVFADETDVFEDDENDVLNDCENTPSNDENTPANEESTFCKDVVSKCDTKRRTWDKILTVALVVAICVLAVVLLLKIFVFGDISVVGDSMLPNFESGQKVWVNKRVTPKRGDVVVFYLNDVNGLWAELGVGSQKGGSAEKYIKRVVALEGDQLWVEKSGNDYVLVVKTPDGQILHEDYYTVDGKPAKFFDSDKNLCDVPLLGTLGNLANTSENAPFVVPQGCFYAMGDNRHNSNDSRAIGAVPFSHLFGVMP